MSDQNTIEFLKIIAPEMESGGEINEDYHDIARKLCARTINVATATTTHLAKTMQLRIKNESMGFKIYTWNNQTVCVNFTLKRGEAELVCYGIDLTGRDWAHDYSIEVFYRNINVPSSQDKLIEGNDFSIEKILKSVIGKHGYHYNDNKTRLFVKDQDGFPYIGNEDAYREVVIEVMRAFAEYAKDNELETEHHR